MYILIFICCICFFIFRFSLLLLEPGETYFEDFSVYCFKPNSNDKEWDQKKSIGRLKMCSKSMVFDPRDANAPLVKIPYRDCIKIYEWKGDLLKRSVLTLYEISL